MKRGKKISKNEKSFFRKIDFRLLISLFVLVLFVAGLGSFFTSHSVNTMWYEAIKPTITPPNWVFPVVWPILFILIAVSMYISVKNAGKEKGKVMALFSANLFLNVFWTFLYFFIQDTFLAFIEIIILWLSIIAMIFIAYKVRKLAAYLLLPYFFWVSFAITLNYLSIGF